MSPDAQWAKLLPKDAYGRTPVIQKAPPDTIKSRPYQGRLPYYYSARHVAMRCAYDCGGPIIRWRMLKPPKIAADSVHAAVVFDVVMRVFGVSMVDLKSQRRHRAITVPRQAACALMKEFTALSYPEIGRLLGNRDHTTILHAVRQTARLYAHDTEFMAKLDECRADLRRELVG